MAAMSEQTPLFGRWPLAALTVSLSMVGGLAVHEGFRDRAYDDGVGVQTIGFGTTTRPDGSPIRPGDRITPERAVVRMTADAARIERQMKACLPPLLPLHQHEWDAFVSLGYNIGSGAFCRSTLARKLRQTPPDYTGACNQILRWNRAGGAVMRGLTVRRQDEHRLCLGLSAPSAPTPASGAAP